MQRRVQLTNPKIVASPRPIILHPANDLKRLARICPTIYQVVLIVALAEYDENTSHKMENQYELEYHDEHIANVIARVLLEEPAHFFEKVFNLFERTFDLEVAQ